jgi:zinc/manganese transport system substrate-binding protein/manganese/iron transport system substrate-binding protein
MAVRALLATLILLCPVAGCGDNAGGEGGLKVVATTTQVGDIARQVSGGRAKVDVLLRPGADPHQYEPRPDDARALASARLVLRSGGDVDSWLAGLLQSAGRGARVASLIDSVSRHGGDPHWWQDPANGAAAARAVASALSRADPAGRAGYAARARAYGRRLMRLDRAVAGCVRRVAPARRRLVTSHDALGYFARRYGIEVIGAVIPSLSTQAQASARDVQRLVERIRRLRVQAVFPESSLNPKLERALARDAGVAVGGALYADTLGPRGSRASSYAGSLAVNGERIVAGISGGRVRCRLPG